MFEQLGLIGCGLMGGSFALALKQAGLVKRVVGYSKSPSTTERARQMGIIDIEAPSALLAVSGADIVLIATPIRWGAASSLFFKMVERLNCVQNQITIADKVLIRNKVAAFIITGGQDNIQGVAGHSLGFFAELGFVFPPFPYIAHSRGWSAEDMENNIEYVKRSKELHRSCLLPPAYLLFTLSPTGT